MSKQEIRVGQTWRHKRSGDECELTSIKEVPGAPLATRVVLLDPVTNKLRPMLATTLTSQWRMVKELGPRRIRLPLAPDTTATECGKRPNRARQSPNDWSLMCFAFRRMLTDDEKRLAECIAAEVS